MTTGSGGGRRRSAPASAAALRWSISVVVGAGGVVLRLSGRPSAVVLVASAVWAWIWSAPVRRRLPAAAWAGSLGACAAATLFLTVPESGRAPAIVALSSVALASSLVWASDVSTPLESGSRRDPRWLGLVALAAVQVAWWATGSNGLVLGSLLAMAAIVSAPRMVGSRAGLRSARVLGTASHALGRRMRAARRAMGAASDRAAHSIRSLRARARHTPPEPVDVAAAASLFVLAAGISAPVWWALAKPAARFTGAINDLPNHILVAAEFRLWPPHTYSPHFLFPMLLRAVGTVAADRAAATVVLSIAFGSTAIVLYWIGRRRTAGGSALPRPAAYLLGLTPVVLESPALLVPAGLALWQRPRIDPIGTGPQLWVLHSWASPTSVLLLPFALALSVRLFDLTAAATGDSTDRRAPAWQLLALTVLATVAKPAVTIVAVVAVPLLWWLRRVRDKASWAVLVGAVVVPGGAIAALQALFTASGANPLEHTSWTWDPFWLVGAAELYRPVLWVPAILPLAAVLGWRGRYLRETSTQVLAAFVAVSFVPTFLLRETGRHSIHANLAWTMVFSLVLLLVFTLRFLLEQLVSSADAPVGTVPRGRLAALAASAAVVGLGVGAGVIHWLVLVGAVAY